MKLSPAARRTLDKFLNHSTCTDTVREDVEELIAMMPDDRVLLYKNVESHPIGDLPRFSIHIRLQHLIIFSTFLLLAFTGLPIRFFDSFWAVPVNQAIGGVDISRVVHRTLAIAMIFGMLYHLVTIVVGQIKRLREGKFEVSRTIVPVLKDLQDFRDDALYFAGRRDQRPEMDKFMYKQKLHYLAASMGNLVMVISGSTFLFPEFWARLLPPGIASQFQEFMRLSHPHEALLALLVIAFWHWYNVHLAPGRFPMQWTFLTGKITREHQMEEHFIEYLRNLVEIPEERTYLRNLLTNTPLSLHQGRGESGSEPDTATKQSD